MIRTKKRVSLCVGLLILNLLFIWGNSLMPGEVSAALSRWVGKFVALLLPGSMQNPQMGHGLLRKLAHFTEFCCLGMCLHWLVGMLGKRPWLSVLGGFLAACVDELIQCFVPNRGPAVTDVLIDTLGVLLGVALVFAGYALMRRRNAKHLEEITL